MSNFIRFSLFTFDALSNIFLIMATNSSKQRRIDKSYKIKYKALKELEKGTPHEDVARMFEIPKNTLSTWKKAKKRSLKSTKEVLEQQELNLRSMKLSTMLS